MQAAEFRVLVLSRISRLGSTGARVCRMASLDRTVCHRLALLIAFCLLFSFIPVAGSINLDLENAKESLNIENMLRLRSVPGLISAPQIFARGIFCGATAGNAHRHTLEVQTSLLSDTQAGQTGRKLLHTFSKPDQGDLSEKDFDMNGINQIQRAGHSDVDGAKYFDPEAGVPLERALFVDAVITLRGDYQMKSLISKEEGLDSQRYIKEEMFDLIEALEAETGHYKKDSNVVSHGLIRIKPIELVKAIDRKSYAPDRQRRALEASADQNTALQRQTGLLRANPESNKRQEERLSKLSSSHFGLGLSRQQEQIHNVVAALRRAGLFAAIAGTIEGMNLFMLPQMVTIFVPTDSAYQALKQEDITFQLFQYHTVMQRYAFSQLCRLREGDILYTLLPGYSIIVTAEQSPFRITLDGVSLIAPDIYVDESIAVHGIDGVFNCSLYGKKFGDWHVPEAAPPPANISGSSSINGSVAGGIAGGNNTSVAGLGETGGHDPAQQTAGTIPTPTTSGDPNTFPFSFSPLTSEVASDTDASDVTISAKIGACAAATAFVCVLSILCC